MRYILIFLVCFLSRSFLAHAGRHKYNCNDLAFAKNKLNIAALNFLNAKTTKTHLGTYYKRKLLNGCFKGKCNIIETNSHKTVYLPAHPDADPQGLVKYPNINPKDEYLAVNSAVKALSKLADLNICHAKKTFQNHQLIVIKYGKDTTNHSFKLLGNRVYSWTTNFAGKDNTINFLN